MPELHVAIGYSDVWNDFDTIDPMEIIKNIPTVPLLKYMVDIHKRVEYAYSDTRSQIQLIRDLNQNLDKNSKKKVFAFINRHDFPFLISHETAVYFYSLVMSKYCSLDKFEDIELELLGNEKEAACKALLYCNQMWTDTQIANNASNMDVIDLSIFVDIPISEYKFHKDFRPQIFKAIQLFKFCESNNTFKEYLQRFIKDKNVNSWNEYIFILFSFLADAINNAIIVSFPIVLSILRTKSQNLSSKLLMQNQRMEIINQPLTRNVRINAK